MQNWLGNEISRKDCKFIFMFASYACSRGFSLSSNFFGIFSFLLVVTFFFSSSASSSFAIEIGDAVHLIASFVRFVEMGFADSPATSTRPPTCPATVSSWQRLLFLSIRCRSIRARLVNESAFPLSTILDDFRVCGLVFCHQCRSPFVWFPFSLSLFCLCVFASFDDELTTFGLSITALACCVRFQCQRWFERIAETLRGLTDLDSTGQYLANIRFADSIASQKERSNRTAAGDLLQRAKFKSRSFIRSPPIHRIQGQ